jgi:hypothetical protein
MNTKLEAVPVAGELGPAQQASVDGPDGPPMQQFCCEVCNNRWFDVKHYFYGITSTKCLWCEKYGKKKPVAKVATKETIDQKS